MFDGPKLDRKFKGLKPEELQKDLDATAKKYNELLNADIFTVSEDPEDIEKVTKDSYNRSGTVLQERWAPRGHSGILRETLDLETRPRQIQWASQWTTL